MLAWELKLSLSGDRLDFEANIGFRVCMPGILDGPQGGRETYPPCGRAKLALITTMWW